MTNKEAFDLKDRAHDIILLVDFVVKFTLQRSLYPKTDVKDLFQFADDFLSRETTIPKLKERES